MRANLWLRPAGWLGMAMLALATTVAAQESGQASPDGEEQSQPAQPSKYWIGVECEPVQNETLRAHLRLPEGQGLLLQDVMPESPASEAGLAQHDVLLKANDMALKTVQDLAGEVARGETMSLEYIRAGKTRQLSVQPAQRPADRRIPLGGPDRRIIMKWLGEDFDFTKPPRLHEFRLMRPGKPMFVAPLPEDVTVSVTRQGKQPARIKVERGDRTWEIGEDELDKLPDDLRPHVERMLGGRIALAPGVMFQRGEAGAPVRLPGIDVESLGGPFQRLEQQIEALNRRFEKLEKAIQRLDKTPPKAGEAGPETEKTD